MENFPCS